MWNRCIQCGQEARQNLGGIMNAQRACASGTADLASFTSQYGTELRRTFLILLEQQDL